ncbi:MAG: T9SS type A sorting domain-containing protein [Bacteroidetes bacterium]|nr:T9SS type A sorting domain-containing protein [Bacteroidota bacterium]
MKNLVFTLTIILLATYIQGYAQTNEDKAEDFTLNTLEGGTFTLSDHSEKVVFLYVFGASCSICLGSGDLTENLYQKYKDSTDFIAIAADIWDESESSVNSFVTSTGLTYTVGLNASNELSSYTSIQDRIFVIDKDTVIQHQSNVSQSNIEDAEMAIDAALTGMSDMPTSINNQHSKADKVLKAYPNPFINDLRLKYTANDATDVNIQIISVDGKIIEQQVINPSNSTEILFNTENWQQGLYIIQMQQQNKVNHVKVVKTIN